MDIFDRYFSQYDKWYEKYKFAYLSELRLLKRVVPKASKGLEIGVGTGRFAKPLKIAFGIDPSENMLKLARQRGVNGILGYGEDIPFYDNFFDYIIILITLCFVKDPLKVLKESKRVLKRNGQLILGIIDKDSFLGRFYQKKKSVFYEKASFLSVKEVEGLLKRSGFNNFSYYQTIFGLPDKLNSVEGSRIGYGQGGFVLIKANSLKMGNIRK